MNEEEKEAIEILEAFEPDDLVECALYRRSITETKNYIEKLQKELDKKDKEIENYKKGIKNYKKVAQIYGEKYIDIDDFFKKVEEENE